jgi:hypothetical protein
MVDISFIKFLLRWIASNLAIPFWVVGHIHLTMNVYKDIHEIIASFGMNIIVMIGIWLDWKEFKAQKTRHTRKFLKR